MKLFSWLNEEKSEDGNPPEAGDPASTISPALQSKLRELSGQKIRDVMVPRAVITALDADVQLRRVRRLKSTKVSFFPVYKGDLDHILGWISKQRVLELLAENSEENQIAQNLKPVGVVHEETSVADLADLFIESSSPFLVVKNAQGSTTGIMPLSELVELIFGFELSAPPAAAAPEPAAPLLRGYEL